MVLVVNRRVNCQKRIAITLGRRAMGLAVVEAEMSSGTRWLLLLFKR